MIGLFFFSLLRLWFKRTTISFPRVYAQTRAATHLLSSDTPLLVKKQLAHHLRSKNSGNTPYSSPSLEYQFALKPLSPIYAATGSRLKGCRGCSWLARPGVKLHRRNQLVKKIQKQKKTEHLGELNSAREIRTTEVPSALASSVHPSIPARQCPHLPSSGAGTDKQKHGHVFVVQLKFN